MLRVARTLGVDVNAEDALGLSNRNLVGEACLYWRFGEHWRLGVDYFNIDRIGTRTLSKDVTWGDYTYPASAQVNA